MKPLWPNIEPEEDPNKVIIVAAICLGCGQRCNIDSRETPLCHRCYFKERIVKPMLAEYAPNAVLEFLPHFEHFVASNAIPGVTTRAVLVPRRWATQTQQDQAVAATYESIRQLVDWDYVFDWRTISKFDTGRINGNPIT